MTTAPSTPPQPGQDPSTAPDATALFAALARELKSVPGFDLLSISRWHPDREELERVYSTDERAYPVGGRKRKSGTAWSQAVIHEGRPHLCRNRDEIRQHFDDHALIERIGVTTILNVPLMREARCLGTVNLLRGRAAYTDADAKSVVATAAALERRSGLFKDVHQSRG